MAANETLDEDAQALNATGRTHVAYGSVVKAGDARLREIERLENSAARRMWWSFVFFCSVCGFIVLRRLPGLGVLWKCVRVLAWIVGKVAPTVASALTALLPVAGDGGSREGGGRGAMQPAFVVLGHHYQETAAIVPGHSSVVAVAGNAAWPSVEIQVRMFGGDIGDGDGRGHGSGVLVVQCGVVVSVWNGDASYGAGVPLSCLTAAAAPAPAMTTTKEDMLEEESVLSAILLRSKEAPVVVDLSEYCSESSSSCSVAAVLCCGNDGDDATVEKANATVTTLLFERARRVQGEEDVDDGVAELVRVAAMEDTGHVAEGEALEKPVTELAVEVLPRDRSDRMVLLQEEEEEAGRREEEDPSPPQPGALVQPLPSSCSSPPTTSPPPPGGSQARLESLP